MALKSPLFARFRTKAEKVSRPCPFPFDFTPACLSLTNCLFFAATLDEEELLLQELDEVSGDSTGVCFL